MGTLELLEVAREWAHRAGFEVREEWLGGVAGGACRIKGKKVLFIDIALPPAERLEQVLQALEQLTPEDRAQMPPQLRQGIEAQRQQAAGCQEKFKAVEPRQPPPTAS